VSLRTERSSYEQQHDANQQSNDIVSSRDVFLIIGVPLVQRGQGERAVCRHLGAIHSVFWRSNARWQRFKMNEVFLFIFGLFATLLAVGPLVIAGLSEKNSKKK
jgi:hypothetical protein